MESPKTFLHYVAEDILHKHGTDLSRTTVVFPNKRASIFLNERLFSIANHPIWSPRYYTISELFRQQSQLAVADDIKLICELYQSYSTLTQSSETLDKFLGWGIVLLKDFNDIDKSLANAHGLFSNLRDIHSFDHVDYLSDNQKEVLKRYFHDFSDNQESKLREKFLNLWCRFSDIYDDYNKRLKEKGLAYEGALYREVIEKEHLELDSDKYIFVGFNALQKVEKMLFKKIKQQSNAYFYWDFDHYYTSPSSMKEAGTFIPELLTIFPNELDKDQVSIYDNFNKNKHITFIGCPTGNMQARYASGWLQDKARVDAGNKTAIVMCDESILPTIIHSIPETVSQMNVTTGFPLAQATITTLVRRLLELPRFGVNNDKYRLRFISPILRHPYSRYISAQSATLLDTLSKNHRYYPLRKELTLDEGLSLLFKDLDYLPCTSDGTPMDRNQVVGRWISDILKRIAVNATKEKEENEQATPDEPQEERHHFPDPLFDESVFRMYTLVNRLNGLMANGDLRVDFITYERLVLKLIDTMKVPFHGEPAIGLQIMGVLETRNLDFDHLLILSCNDNNMPRGVEDTSFIPYSLREAFELPTTNHTVAIYAYNFYRMLQRASDITIMYRNTADDKQTGEMSRFMLQMMIESPHTIVRKSLISGQEPMHRDPRTIEKTPEVMRHLNSMSYLSPTAINRFIKCPLLFFYNHVAGIKEPEADEEEIDYRTFGLIFHDASQFFYEKITGISPDQPTTQRFLGDGIRVERKDIEQITKTPEALERIVDDVFCSNLFKDRASQPEYNGLQLVNREVILLYLRQMLKIDIELTPFIIRGMEGDVYDKLRITTTEGEREVTIGGRIDRMDEINIGKDTHTIRIVDYKTGSKLPGKMSSIEDVFSPEKISAHSNYYVQAMLYAMIVSRSIKINPQQLPVVPALLFIQHAGIKDYNPVLGIDGNEITDMHEWNESFESHLRSVITQMLEPGNPFEPTKDRKNCFDCPYKHLCGRSNHEKE